ncbi:MAG TPA: hypothetical protein VLG16_03330 [Candidatus Saccharimonadales bacterium]|nr:hypothetical protein [Candidatus Saccharimonadales bacterium]
MTPDQYLAQLLQNYEARANQQQALALIQALSPDLRAWAGNLLFEIIPAGSYAKGTAIAGLSDLDILVSISSQYTGTLEEMYWSLHRSLDASGYSPRAQNVSVGINAGNWKVDIVPAKRQPDLLTFNHSLWSKKSGTHRTTNIHRQIATVSQSRHKTEIKLVKIWKMRHGLEFPSYLLETTVMEALRGTVLPIFAPPSLANNFMRVLRFIQDELPNRQIIDPVKQSNILSDELTVEEKRRLSQQAGTSIAEPYWENIVW